MNLFLFYSNPILLSFFPLITIVVSGGGLGSILCSGILNPFIRCGVIQQARNGSETAYIADYLWRKNRKMTMLIDSRCGVSPFGNLQYLSPRVEMPVVDNIITELQKYADNPPLFLIDSNRE